MTDKTFHAIIIRDNRTNVLLRKASIFGGGGW